MRVQMVKFSCTEFRRCNFITVHEKGPGIYDLEMMPYEPLCDQDVKKATLTLISSHKWKKGFQISGTAVSLSPTPEHGPHACKRENKSEGPQRNFHCKNLLKNKSWVPSHFKDCLLEEGSYLHLQMESRSERRSVSMTYFCIINYPQNVVVRSDNLFFTILSVGRVVLLVLHWLL